MAGTMSGVNTALSALRHQQVVMDVVSNNVSNVNTAGYVRRSAQGAQIGGSGEPVMYAFNNSPGDGVATAAVQRMFDQLVDTRVRRESGKLSYLTTTQAVMKRVETAINEPGAYGINQAISNFNGALQDLTSNPGGQAARTAVVAKADALMAAVRTQADNVSGEAVDQSRRATTLVGQVNDSAAQLAELNRSIYVAEGNGSDVGALYDQRDSLALKLATLVGATVSVATDGRYQVGIPNVGGTPALVSLVAGDTPAPLTMSVGAGGALSYSLSGSTLGTVKGALGGELGGVTDVVNHTLIAHQSALGTLAQTLVNEINAANALGHDANGDPGGDLLEITDPANPAGSVRVLPSVATNPGLIAASSIAGAANLDGGNADEMSIATTIGADYAALVTAFGAQVLTVNNAVVTQRALTSQVIDEQQQLVGVNLDEETVNLVAAQHAYEAAAKLMQVLDSVLSTLINMKS